MSGKRRNYTPEFREQAARLVIETGRPVAHVAAEIGVGEQLLGRWVRLQRRASLAGDTGAMLDADKRAELERLRRENAELRLDREFLKKAAAFFVSNTTGRGLPGDRGGEGHLPDQADVPGLKEKVLLIFHVPAYIEPSLMVFRESAYSPGAAVSFTLRVRKTASAHAT
jgi:transposase